MHATGWRAAALFSIALALGAAVQAAGGQDVGQSLALFANEGGIEIDIIRAALAVSGHTLTLSFCFSSAAAGDLLRRKHSTRQRR